MAIVIVALSVTIYKIFAIYNVHDLDFDLENGPRSNVNIQIESPCICDFLYDSNSNIGAICDHLHKSQIKVHKSNKNATSLTFKMKVKVKEETSLTFVIQPEMFNYLLVLFLQNVIYTATYVYAKCNIFTYLYMHSHNKRRMLTIGKIYLKLPDPVIKHYNSV